MKSSLFKWIIFQMIIFAACNKGGDNPPGNGGGGGDDTTANKTDCILSIISQVNSGSASEYSLSAFYNSNYEVTKLVIYDSVDDIKNFEADFNYVTQDSVRIDQYQYMILDGEKRIIKFITKSDMSNPQNADDYLFTYTYNNKGFLAAKNLYINGSSVPNFNTTYTYTNDVLTNCEMIAPSSGNKKVLESTLTYDTTIKIKNWIYTFPDAMEGYIYLTIMNLGNHVVNPLKQVVTKIYDPASAKLLDTWTTNYNNYKVDDNGYVVSGNAEGDQQQGIAAFYGKTNFYYDCH